MSDAVMKSVCDSEFAIGKEDNGDLVIQLKIKNMPGVLVDHILKLNEDLPMPIIRAIMSVLGAKPMNKSEVEELLSDKPVAKHAIN